MSKPDVQFPVSKGSVAPPRVPAMRPGKAGGKRDENRRRKVEDLCRGALTLMLEFGVEGVSVEHLAKAGGVAKGSFYRYFETKEDLARTVLTPLRQSIETSFDACAQAIEGASDDGALTEAYAGLAQGVQRVLLYHPREILLYLQECRGPSVGARVPVRELADIISRRAIELTHEAQRRGLLAAFPARISALAVVGAAERLLFELLSGGDVGVPMDAAESLIRLIMDGLRVNP